MAELREVVMAHYEILPPEEKTKIRRDYEKMVSEGSVVKHFKSNFEDIELENLDETLETWGWFKDGMLDFNYYLALKYILENENWVECDVCSSVIMGRSYFSCHECFFGVNSSYDLCCSCYAAKKFEEHDHHEFRDSYALYKESREMIAKMKRGQGKEKGAEDVLIGCASELLELAKVIKTQNDNSGDLDSALKEKLSEISRNAQQLQEMPQPYDEHVEFVKQLMKEHRLREEDLLGMTPTC